MKIPHYDQCVAFALRMNCLTGDNLKETTLRVFEREVANPATVFKAMKKGGLIFPAVSADLLGGNPGATIATFLVSADEAQGMVTLYDAAGDTVVERTVADFLNAWEASNGHCVTAFPPLADTYQPKLLDMQHTPLPDDCAPLLEAMAENVHDMWAIERQSEGWSYGPQRNDERLETPDMVAYDQLPESEKQYDRKVAADTLRLLTVLGYKIVKND